MRSLLTLLPYFKRYRAKFIAGILLTAFSCLTAAIMPRFVGEAINSLQAKTATTESLLWDAAGIVGMSLLTSYAFYWVRQTIIVASREIEFDLRNDFLEHLLTLPMSYFQNTPQGEVMAYATNDINAVRNAVGPAIMYAGDAFLTFVFSLVYMLAISPKLTLISLAPLPLMSIAVYFIGKRVQPLFDGVQSHYSDLTARATESISGMKVVKAYVRESYEHDTFDKLSDEYYQKNMRLIKIQGLMMPAIFGFVGLSVVLLLLFGAPSIISGEFRLGDLTQFLIYLGMLTWPFMGIGIISNMVQRSAASMARLNKVFDTTSNITDTPATDASITEIEGKVEFRNVSFKYRDELPTVLDTINLEIPKGHTLAIIGKTGSGKSSFVQLIPRLYDTTGGTIFIDGKDIRTIPIETLRKSIGMVQQESFLFSESLQTNIAYGVQDPVADELIKAANHAEIYKDVSEFPHQFETVIGERGITLSGGQKQRTSLARAIARNPKILILDDAMSAVDTATEERILQNLRQIMKGRTSIIISHRISTVKDADEIIVLDDGKISERGTHSELLSLGGAYHDLYRKQLLEEALEQAV
jgi:ATP-binding cassette subfamily B multidrug efflux pump